MLRFDKGRDIPRLLQFVGIDLKKLLLVRVLEGRKQEDVRYNVRNTVSKRGRYRCTRNNTLMKFHFDVQTKSRSNANVRR
jgi:hypothetical protein